MGATPAGINVMKGVVEGAALEVDGILGQPQMVVGGARSTGSPRGRIGRSGLEI